MRCGSSANVRDGLYDRLQKVGSLATCWTPCVLIDQFLSRAGMKLPERFCQFGARRNTKLPRVIKLRKNFLFYLTALFSGADLVFSGNVLIFHFLYLCQLHLCAHSFEPKKKKECPCKLAVLMLSALRRLTLRQILWDLCACWVTAASSQKLVSGASLITCSVLRVLFVSLFFVYYFLLARLGLICVLIS